MKDEPVCGDWHPEIYSNKGLIPVDSSVPKLTVDCTVTSIFPTIDLNVLGHDNLTISGTNFPRYLQDNTIEIEFDNLEKAKCIPQITDSTELVCLTSEFNKLTELSQTYSPKIVINRQEIPNAL